MGKRFKSSVVRTSTKRESGIRRRVVEHRSAVNPARFKIDVETESSEEESSIGDFDADVYDFDTDEDDTATLSENDIFEDEPEEKRIASTEGPLIKRLLKLCLRSMLSMRKTDSTYLPGSCCESAVEAHHSFGGYTLIPLK